MSGEVRKLRSAARNTLLKDKRINIRMSSRDLNQVQVIAAQEGIPSSDIPVASSTSSTHNDEILK